jgi:hypothetical protein
MEAIDGGHIIPLDIGGLRRETRYVETKYPWNLGKTRHQVINIGKLNLKQKQKAY